MCSEHLDSTFLAILRGQAIVINCSYHVTFFPPPPPPSCLPVVSLGCECKCGCFLPNILYIPLEPRRSLLTNKTPRPWPPPPVSTPGVMRHPNNSSCFPGRRAACLSRRVMITHRASGHLPCLDAWCESPIGGSPSGLFRASQPAASQGPPRSCLLTGQCHRLSRCRIKRSFNDPASVSWCFQTMIDYPSIYLPMLSRQSLGFTRSRVGPGNPYFLQAPGGVSATTDPGTTPWKARLFLSLLMLH